MPLSEDNVLLNLLVEAVATIPLNTIEFGRLSITGLQYLLYCTFEKEKPLRVDDIVTPEERAVNFEEQWYQSFLKGQIREGLTLSSEQRTLLDLWAKSGYIVFQKYPNLINSDASGYNVDFDPEWMHIWETRDIEFAIARPIIVDIMGGADRVKHHFDWIKKALGNLEKFTSSQEFKEIPISTQNQ